VSEEQRPFLVFGAPLIGQEEIDEVVDSLHTGWLGTGPKVARFERDFAAYKGVARATAVNSCTAALHLSMLASGLEPGDRVITSPMTFCASVNAIIHAGLEPVLADIDPVTMNLDPATVATAITPRTKAILPVHFAGRMCDMKALGALADRHGLKIIEDCAHAIEASRDGLAAGTVGDFGCFSFYVTKNLITGEGGMVLTKRPQDADRIKRLALHGLSSDAWKRFSDSGYKHYFVEECGYKYNMMDLQAAIGMHQLGRIERTWHRRAEIWERYQVSLASTPLGLPAPPEPGTRHAYHLFTVMVDKARCGIDRDTFLEAMTAQGIGIGVHYLSIPEHPYYQRSFGWSPDDVPHARDVGRQTVSLPLSPKLTDADVTRVIDTVTEILGHATRA